MKPKTVLITGASSGIGVEFAKLFAKNGYNLILVARREERLVRVSEELSNKYHVNVMFIVKDLSEPSSPREIFNELREKNVHIDILVNNAGTQIFGEFQKTDIDAQVRLIQTNLISLTYLTHLAVEEMRKKGYGKILNLGSIASFGPGPLNAVYCATKAYVLSFSEAIASDLNGTGITVTTLCPGATQSEFAEKAKMTNTWLFKKMVMDAETVARIGYRALFKGKRVVISGFWNKLMILSARFTPRGLMLRISKLLVS